MTLTRILIGAVVLVAVAGLALFVLDRTIFAPVAVDTAAPVAPTLVLPPTGSTASPAASPVTTEGTASATSAPPTQAPDASSGAGSGVQRYQIDPEASEVRYEVGETFFNNNTFAIAVGRTSGLAGEVLVDFENPSNSQVGEIVVNVSQFTSDENRRDNFIRRSGLESSIYPEARFVPNEIQGLPETVAVGDQLSLNILGDLTIKETTQPSTWDVTLTVEEDRLVGSATTQILMSDFGVGPIQIPTLATEDEVNLFFDFVLVPVEG